MGALQPWHLLVSAICCLAMTAVVAVVILLFARSRGGRPPSA